MRLISLFALGVLFAFGLAVSGMTQPTKVLGFLDVFGLWDPTLAFVMGSALVVAHIGFRKVLKRSCPVLVSKFDLPTARSIDLRLVLGASVFGVGWGTTGYCPGPALVAVGSGDAGIVLFVLAMFAGFFLKDVLDLALPVRPTQEVS